MNGPVDLVLTLVALLVSVLAFGGCIPCLPMTRFRAPVGQFGGSLPRDTPVAPRHPFVGTRPVALSEGDQPRARVVSADDGFVLFTDAGENRGAGV